MKLRTLSVGARCVIAGTLLAGAGAVALRIPETATWTRPDVLTLVGLTLAILVTEQFSVPLRLRTETLNFTLTDAAFTAGLILARPGVLTLALLAGVVAGQLMKRWDAVKVAFNVGTYLIGITGAEIMYHAFGPAGARDPEAWGAAGAGPGPVERYTRCPPTELGVGLPSAAASLSLSMATVVLTTIVTPLSP